MRRPLELLRQQRRTRLSRGRCAGGSIRRPSGPAGFILVILVASLIILFIIIIDPIPIGPVLVGSIRVRDIGRRQWSGAAGAIDKYSTGSSSARRLEHASGQVDGYTRKGSTIQSTASA